MVKQNRESSFFCKKIVEFHALSSALMHGTRWWSQTKKFGLPLKKVDPKNPKIEGFAPKSSEKLKKFTLDLRFDRGILKGNCMGMHATTWHVKEVPSSLTSSFNGEQNCSIFGPKIAIFDDFWSTKSIFFKKSSFWRLIHANDMHFNRFEPPRCNFSNFFFFEAFPDSTCWLCPFWGF